MQYLHLYSVARPEKTRQGLKLAEILHRRFHVAELQGLKKPDRD